MPDFGESPTGRYAGYGQPDAFAPSVANGQISLADWNAYMAKRKRDALIGGVATVGGAALAPYAVSAMGGAPVGAVSSASVPTVTAPAVKAASSGFSLSNLLDLGKLATGLWGTISGNKANSTAQAQALAEQQREFNAQQQMLAANEDTRKAEALRVSDEQARQWEAGQQFAGQQFRSQEEQRLHDRALMDAAEARRAPRRAIGQQALMRLSDFLGLARR